MLEDKQLQDNLIKDKHKTIPKQTTPRKFNKNPTRDNSKKNISKKT
jgi:hypothetical protein